MNALPAPYQQHTAPAGQPLNGWPTIPDAPLTGAVELYGDQSVVYVPGPYGQMVPVLKQHLPTAPVMQQPRDLTPSPLLDPLAQRIVAGGVLAGGVGWGGGQLLLGASQLMSGLSGAGLFLIALAAVACRMAPALAGGGRTTVTNTTTHNVRVTNENRWLGHSKTNVH